MGDFGTLGKVSGHIAGPLNGRKLSSRDATGPRVRNPRSVGSTWRELASGVELEGPGQRFQVEQGELEAERFEGGVDEADLQSEGRGR